MTRKDLIMSTLLAIGFLTSIAIGVGLGNIIFEDNMYGELFPATLGMSFGAVYNYILVSMYITKDNK